MEDAEREFQRLWGPWATVAPADAAALFDGYPRMWWISGGWAIEAFTGEPRPHKDVDVTVFRRDVSSLREHFRGRYDLWAAGNGTLRPLDNCRPAPPAWSGQLWIREHALAPWLLDVQLNPGGSRRWVFKRDSSLAIPIDDATWVAADGFRYLRPELVLAHKVHLRRTVDDEDLKAVLPLLEPRARTWLRDFVAVSEPGHSWNEVLRRRKRR